MKKGPPAINDARGPLPAVGEKHTQPTEVG